MSDYPVALSKLERLNNLILNNRELKSVFVTDDWNFLQSYQDEMFYEIRSILEKSSNTQDILVSNIKPKTGLSIRYRQVTALLLSIYSYIFLLLPE